MFACLLNDLDVGCFLSSFNFSLLAFCCSRCVSSAGLPPGWLSGKPSALSAADPGLIPNFGVDLFPGQVIPVI